MKDFFNGINDERNVYVTDIIECTCTYCWSADQRMVQKQFSAWWTHKSKVRLTFSCLTTTTQCCLFPVHHSRGSCSRLAVLLCFILSVCCCINQTVLAFKSIFSQITCVALRSFCWGFLACEARGTASPISNITSPNELLSLPLCYFINVFSHFVLESQAPAPRGRIR